MQIKKELKLKNQHIAFYFKYLLVGMFLFIASVSAQAQNKTITGLVSDDQKVPLPGVSVSIKGSTTGVQTDVNGKYSIQAKATDKLVFSYVGYSPTTLLLENKSVINVTLKAMTTGLDEVVVVGYGTQKRKDITGSVSKVSVEDMLKAPVRSFEDALAGRVAGVQVTSSDGQPGAGVNIVIRGNNSVSQSNAPLYVIDGFPMEGSDNNAINPQDIESVEVLKDASATAIYGARGANGVIVITTKKGKKGAPVFSLNASYGLQESISKMEMMNPYEFVKYQIEIDPTLVSATRYLTPTQVYLTGPGKTLDDYKAVKGIDWQDKVTRVAPVQDYNLSVMGGNKDTKYSFSGSLNDTDGILINSGYKRYQGRMVIDQNLTKKIKIGLNTNYSHLEQSGISPSISTNSSTTNIMVSVWGMRPVVDPNGVLFGDGDLFDPVIDPANDYRVNPYKNLSNLYRLNTTKILTSNAYLEFQILPELKLRVTSGIVENRRQQNSFNNSYTQYGHPGSQYGVNGSIMNSQFSNWLNENTLTWNKKFAKKHSVNVVGGFTIQKQTSKSYGRSANQIPLEFESLGLAGLDYGVPLRVDTFNSVWTMASFLGRINYNYNSKYLFTASMRADGSSKFPIENHWGYFPSGAFSWRFKNEKFLKSSNVLSDGKLRTSYGLTGNNRVGDFSYLTTYFTPIENSYVFNNNYVPGIVATNLGNSKLKWETTEQTDLGLDLGFFKQRITLTADVYRKTTSDLLLNAILPATSGFSSSFKNIGKIQNQGLELTLDTQNINSDNFKWSSSFNISFNESKVLALTENQTELQSTIAWDSSWTNTPAYIAKIGEPLGMMYGYISEGTYKYSDFDQDVNGKYILKANVATNGNTSGKIQPGDIKYKDINGDLVVNALDYTVIGHGLPKNTGGFSNNFIYKGFDLNVFFQWSYGNDIMNANRIMFDGNSAGRVYLNQFASYENRWTPENPDSNDFRTKGFFGGGYSSRYVEDGSYLRLKTVSFGYNFEPKLLRKINLKEARIYLAAQNLVTWTKYSGSDPEVNVYNSALTSGFDFSTYPRAHTISLGTNIKF
jgi:TonB-linked SusC/RagA family outer membrane protein